MPFPDSFDANGVLPIGTHSTTFDELRQSLLVLGAGDETAPGWDGDWRLTLVNNASVLVGQLWQVGITEVFLDGSFTEAKASPNDIDGYFEVDVKRVASGDLERELNALDPHKVWTWDAAQRRRHRNSTK